MSSNAPHPRRARVTGDLYHPHLPDGAVWAMRQAPGHRRAPYANPHPVGKSCKPCGGLVHTLADALRLYGEYLDQHPELVAMAAAEPADARFACRCPLAQPCHVDTLLGRVDEHALAAAVEARPAG